MAFANGEKQELIDRVNSIDSKVDDLDKKFTRLDKVIRGPEDAPEPLGLVGKVFLNTNFRNTITWWLSLLVVAVTGLIVERLMAIMGG